MVKNKSSLFGIVALIIGASGLGLGVFSVVNFQTVEGSQGIPGNDGQDGVDGEDGTAGINGTDGQDMVGLQVGILDPDHNEIVSGLVSIRVLLWNSSQCAISVFINGSLRATQVPWVWNTTAYVDGWYNISVKVIDTESNIAQDEVIVHVLNNPPLHTIEYYFFDNVVAPSWFFNIMYDITEITVFLITISSNDYPSNYPYVWLYHNSVSYFNEKIQYSGTLGGIFVNGIYEIRFYSDSGIQDFHITIELTEV